MLPSLRPRLILLLPAGLYLLSLVLPAMNMTYADDGSTGGGALRGYEVLLSGWLMVPAGNPAWLANPLAIWAALMLWRGHRQRAPLLIISPIMFAAAALPMALAIETGEQARRSLYGGYYLWLASIGILVIVALWWWRRTRPLVEGVHQ